VVLVNFTEKIDRIIIYRTPFDRTPINQKFLRLNRHLAERRSTERFFTKKGHFTEIFIPKGRFTEKIENGYLTGN
jgi:hypothetical protein